MTDDQVAARSGSLEIARLLVAAGAKRAMTDIRGNTALLLHCSGLGVNPAMLETLATSTVIDTSNWDGWWPLLAIVSGEILKNELTRLLVDSDKPESYGWVGGGGGP